MKRLILMGASLAIFAGAAYYGATGAFFSDTEASTGNTFTAGAIDLTVDSTSHYAGLVCSQVTAGIYQWIDDPADQTPTTRPELLNTNCSGTWAATDLGAANQFFNFGDVKPGDPGEDTVSLHINNNDAWACMDLITNSNNENTAIEPELSAGDTAANGSSDGELAQNLSFTTWRDNASTSGAVPGDNIHQAGEQILSGPIAASNLIGATTTLALADSTTGSGPMIGGATSFVGIAWCVGTQAVAVGGAITCDGTSVPNTVQTDSATSTVSFRVVQARNNANFTCGTPVAGPTEVNVTANSLNGWSWFNDTTNVVDNALGAFVAGPGVPPLGTGSASTTLADGTSRVYLQNNSYGNIPLASISQLAYTEYSQSGVGGANEAPFVRFNVDFTTGSPVYQNSLVYVPGANGSITKDTWQTWNMIAPGALWNYSGAFWPAGVTTVANTVVGTTNRTWTAILADYPNIRTWNTGPQIGIRFGEPGPAGYSGNVDSFTIATGGPATTYDFGN